MPYYIGLDLGGTDIKGGLLEGPRVLTQQRTPTQADQGPDHVIDRMADLARAIAQDAGVPWDRIEGIGVGTPGPTDGHGTVLQAPNLPGWSNIPLQQRLADRTRRPVVVVNDANAATYGEYWAGAAHDQHAEHMLFLTLGTGVGGGAVIDGQLYAGAHQAGTELGHMILYPHGRPCGCGQRGCLEQYTSATAIAADAHRALQGHGEGNAPPPLPQGEGRGEGASSLPPNPTCRDVFDAAADNDPLALQIVDQAADHLGIACVNLVRIFDPQIIILGGGVVAAGDALIRRVRSAFDRHTWTVRPEKVAIHAATLGNDAGFIGAAALTAQNTP